MEAEMQKKKLINGSNHQSSRIINRSLVLKMICTGNNLSRVDMARQTGLSKMSITNIVNGLISEGFVSEKTESQDVQPTGSSGRKPVYLTANTGKYLVLGLYVSRDNVIATLANLNCEINLELQCSFSRSETKQSFIEKIYMITESVLGSKEAAGRNILGIGVACIGPLDLKNGIILGPPNFHNLGEIKLKRLLEERFGYEVYINNDMNASALAEKLYGKGKNTRNFVYVGVTNGIGAGIIANGSLFEGDMGFGGEIGHIAIDYDGPPCACGNSGCLELYASIPEIVKKAKKAIYDGASSTLKDPETIQWPDIAAFAVEGDSLAVEMVELLCKYMSYGLISLINFFDPQVIYLGHDIALAGDLAAGRLEANISKRFFSSNYKSVPIEISAFCHKAPVAGSAAIILDKLFGGHEFRNLQEYGS